MRTEIEQTFISDMNECVNESVERSKSIIFDVEEIKAELGSSQVKMAAMIQGIDQMKALIAQLRSCSRQSTERSSKFAGKEAINSKNLQTALGAVSKFRSEMPEAMKACEVNFRFDDHCRAIEGVHRIIREENEKQSLVISNLLENQKQSMQNADALTNFGAEMQNNRPMQDNLKAIMDLDAQFKSLGTAVESNTSAAIESEKELSRLNEQLSSNVGKEIEWCEAKLANFKEKEMLKYPSNGNFFDLLSNVPTFLEYIIFLPPRFANSQANVSHSHELSFHNTT